MIQKPNATLCLTSGSSPEGVFKVLVEKAQNGLVNFDQVCFVGLDEWVGISPQNTGSCWYSVNENLFKPLNIKAQNIFFFDALADNLFAECERIDNQIAKNGGFDLMLLGIGLNGHVGMNEPQTPWHLYSHVIDLHEMTKTVGQKYFESQTTLNQGITLGFQYIKEAKAAILMANGYKKKEVIHLALTGIVSEDFPASIFQTLPNGFVMTDQLA